MTLANALATLSRRWLVVLLGGLASIWACVAVVDTVPPSYQAGGDLLFVLPSQASGVETPSNPLLNLDAGQATIASLLGTQMSGAEVRADLARQGFGAEYSVALVPGSGPLLNIVTLDQDPEQALVTRNAVIAEINARLAALQEATPGPQRQTITTRASSVTEQATRLAGSQRRALAGTAALGLLITLLLAFALDPLLTRGSRRRQERRAQAAAAAGAPAASVGTDREHPEDGSTPADRHAQGSVVVADAAADSDLDSDPDSDLDTDSDSDTDSDIDLDTDTDLDTDPDTDPDTDLDTDSDTDSDTDRDDDAEAGTDHADQPRGDAAASMAR